MNTNRQPDEELHELLGAIEEGSISARGIQRIDSWSAATGGCCGSTSSMRVWSPDLRFGLAEDRSITAGTAV